MVAILALAALPFTVKATTMFLGATGYGLQTLYKFAQVLAPAWWRYAQGERGVAVAWPVREPWPSARLLAVSIASGTAFGLSAIIAASSLAPAFGMDPETLRAGFDNTFKVDGVWALAVVVFLSFANSAIEELHFRIWLDGETSKRWGNAAGIAVSACAFGAMHGFILLGFPTMPIVLGLLITCCLIFAGVCWSLMVRHPGGIYAAWISHGLTNVLLLGWGLFWLGYV